MNNNLLISSLQSSTYSYDVLVVFTRSLLFYTSMILSYPIDEWIHHYCLNEINESIDWIDTFNFFMISCIISLMSSILFILNSITIWHDLHIVLSIIQLFQFRWWLKHIYSHFDMACSYTPFSFVEYLNRIEYNDITSTIECIHNNSTQC